MDQYLILSADPPILQLILDNGAIQPINLSSLTVIFEYTKRKDVQHQEVVKIRVSKQLDPKK